MTTATDHVPGFRDAGFTARVEVLAALLGEFRRRGWTPATSSNFSFRVGPGHCAVTASGGDKATVREEDLLIVDLDGRVLDGAPDRRPSAEAGLHQALYRRDATIGAVLHTHAPRALLAARVLRERPLRLAGYELLKAFEGIDTHAAELAVPVVANDQDIDRLAAAADALLDGTPGARAYLIEGHGVYAWGSDLAAAARHLEALDYLLGIELELLRLGSR
ncbi:MAG: methylthioribulose 1-phosphate dehydratase [Pseudomonadales bacterium]|jgi:methylthioribulose-1-phosphate dehydratase|nr:methylthioribulose 1-phosphate dehydratase [Pseudomonadales bacterium]